MLLVMAKRKMLEPLIPLEDLKKVLSGLARVPRDKVEEARPAPKPYPKKGPDS
jgi:hypothetical protein